LGFIGQPERVFYEASNFRSGLINVRALVLKPDNSIAGPYTFTELPPAFAGRYFFDFMTGPTDPLGNYLVSIVSPTENLQTSFRFGMELLPATKKQLDDTLATITAISASLQISAGQLVASETQLMSDILRVEAVVQEIKCVADLFTVTFL
jgi:hypothetical protein